jgi:hypothetical protein
METKPETTKNDALKQRTLSKKTDVKGRLYLLTTGALIGVRQRLRSSAPHRPSCPAFVKEIVADD